MRDLDAHICLLQEITWHNVHNQPDFVSLRDFKVYYNHSDFSDFRHKKGGTAILVRDDLESTKLELPDRDTSCSTWAKIFCKDSSFTLGSCYYHPNQPDTVGTLRTALEKIEGKTLICGDLNAQDAQWDSSCRKTNKAGQILKTLIDDFNLYIHNSEMIPTHDRRDGTRPSVIDLTLSSISLTPQVEVEVLKDLPEAHHRPILIQVRTVPLVQKALVQGESWRIHAADEKVFQEECERLFSQKLPELLAEKSPHQLGEKIENLFQAALGKTVPKTKRNEQKLGFKRQPWFTKEIQRLIRACKKARRYVQRFPKSAGCRHRYNRLVKKKKEAIDRARQSFETKFWKESASKSQNYMWKAIKEEAELQSRTVPTLEGNITDPKAKAEQFLKRFRKVTERTKNSKDFDEAHRQEVLEYLEKNRTDFEVKELGFGDYNLPITEEEFHSALEKLKNTSPGPDGIPNWAYKHSSSSARKVILFFFNLSFSSGEFPNLYRKSDLISLPKKGKDLTKPGSYRPIALTNTLARIFEKIIQNRLYAHCESLDILPASQFAYRKNHSSVDPLILLTQDIKNGFEENHSTLMLQLDITKAFDTVWLDGLRYKLHKVGIRGPLLAWLSSFLKERQYRVLTPQATDYEPFSDGVPQGSGLSPLLFIIFISDMAEELHCQHAEFSDDLTLWTCIKDRAKAKTDLEHDLRAIERWSNKWRIAFGEKCSFTPFYKNYRQLFEPSLTFNNLPLKKETEPKLLGVNLDHSLSFTRHLSIVETTLRRKIGILYKIIGKKLGSNRPALISIYKGWIRPSAEYASVLFASAKKSLLEKLESLQSSALRAILGASRNTPAIILTTECAVSPLRVRRDIDVLNKLKKIQSLPPWHSLKLSFEKWKKLISPYERVGERTTGYSFFGYAISTYSKVLGQDYALEPLKLLPIKPRLPWYPERENPLMEHDFISEFKTKVTSSFRLFEQKQHQESKSNTHYRNLKTTCLPQWPHQHLPARSLSVILFKLRSGYCKIGDALHYQPFPPCPGCGNQDSIQHFLVECSAYDAQRQRMKSQLPLSLRKRPLSIQLLLGKPRSTTSDDLRTTASAVAKFVIRSRRFI